MLFLSIGSVGDSLFSFYSSRVRRVEKLKKSYSNCPRLPLYFQESLHAWGNKEKKRQEKIKAEASGAGAKSQSLS